MGVIRRHPHIEELRDQDHGSLLFESNPLPMWIYDPTTLRIRTANAAMQALYGYSHSELLDLRVPELWEPAGSNAQAVHLLSAQESFRARRRHVTRHGSILEVDIFVCPVQFDGIDARLVTAVDLTQGISASRELARVQRAQQMLSRCNKALIRASSEAALLHDVCQTTVQVGGYLGAMVGYARDDDKCTIERVAHAGTLPQFILDSRWFSTWCDTDPLGQGAAGRTIRERTPIIYEELSGTSPWDEQLVQGGISSLVSLPLRKGEAVFGLLYLVNQEPIKVSDDEVDLLQELADNLAFGLQNLQAQATIRDQAALLDKAQDAIIVRGMDGRISFWNQGAERLYGIPRSDALGKNIIGHLYPDAEVEGNAQVQLRINGIWAGEVRQKGALGQELAVETSWTLIRDDEGNPKSILEISTDITQRKASELKIHRLAYYDSLTELPNRVSFSKTLEKTLAKARAAALYGALLFIDLDNFKTLNDTLGHDQGDALLVLVARRLLQTIDGKGVVGRMGGDEFVVMVDELSTSRGHALEIARDLAMHILRRMAEPFEIQGCEHASTISIGVALFGEGDSGVGELMKQADLAMYEAKSQGRNAVRFFDPGMQEAINDRARLEAEMRKALAKSEFTLAYQPQYNSTGTLIGFEALLRWHSAQSGTVSPAKFIPLAEETGIIISLGQWVMATACQMLHKLQSEPQSRHVSMAVNVSARQFHSVHFVDQVREIVRASNIDARHLKLELTESILVTDVESTITKMRELKELGICFSLDDFGTGYSSLYYLKRLPLDQLKIDQSFVRDIGVDANDAAIVKTVIALGESLGLSVIAEGVETQSQLAFLSVNGCLAYQGYLFGRPVPEADIPRVVATAVVP